MKKFEKFHSLIFSLITFFGLEILAYYYSTGGQTVFIFISLIFLFVFVFEALLSFKFAQNLKSKLPLPSIIDDIKHIHITHHIILPLMLYIGVCGFIFFNFFSLQSQLIILIGTITFFSIFQGQRYSFKQEFSFDETLHYIYDSIKIIIYFIGVDIIIQTQLAYSINNTITFVAIQLVAFILLLLTIVRKQQFNSLGIIYIFVSSVILSSLTIIQIGHINPLVIALISSVFYYLLVAVMHHKINATLSISIILEYLVITAIILLALRGISY